MLLPCSYSVVGRPGGRLEAGAHVSSRSTDSSFRTAAAGRHDLSRSLKIAGWVAIGAATILLAVLGGHGELTVPRAVVIGAVEGITEFLPVSSTGHLIVAERLIGLDTGGANTAVDAYTVVVQIGAILAVVLAYRARIGQLIAGLFGRDEQGRKLLGRLTAAIIPAGIIGAALESPIKSHLYGPWPIIAAWAIGGMFLLWWKAPQGRTSIMAISVSGALIIGVAQALALWPGVSRSLVTIVAALALGCEMGAAVEFSFLLGLATLTAATVLDLAKDGSTLVHDFGIATPLLGVLVAFVTATLAVRWMISYLRTRPLTGFGWYRLLVAAVTISLVVTNTI